jgi:hypothetical protein
MVSVFWDGRGKANADKLKYNARHHIDHNVRRRNTSEFVAFEVIQERVWGSGGRVSGRCCLGADWVMNRYEMRCSSTQQGVYENGEEKSWARLSMGNYWGLGSDIEWLWILRELSEGGMGRVWLVEVHRIIIMRVWWECWRFTCFKSFNSYKCFGSYHKLSISFPLAWTKLALP